MHQCCFRFLKGVNELSARRMLDVQIGRGHMYFGKVEPSHRCGACWRPDTSLIVFGCVEMKRVINEARHNAIRLQTHGSSFCEFITIYAHEMNGCNSL